METMFMNTENGKTSELHKSAHILLQRLYLRSSYSVPIQCRYPRLYRVYYENHETLTNNPPIFINIHSMNERLVLRIKHEYKLELQTAETI